MMDIKNVELKDRIDRMMIRIMIDAGYTPQEALNVVVL